MSVYIGGQECLQASLQLQQDQPQLRIRIPQDVQPRTNQCKGGDNKYYVKSVDVNSYKCIGKVLDESGVMDIRAVITFKGKVGIIFFIIELY